MGVLSLSLFLAKVASNIRHASIRHQVGLAIRQIENALGRVAHRTSEPLLPCFSIITTQKLHGRSEGHIAQLLHIGEVLTRMAIQIIG